MTADRGSSGLLTVEEWRGGVITGEVLGDVEGGASHPRPVSASNFGSSGENKVSMNVSSRQFSHTSCPDLLSLCFLYFLVQIAFLLCQSLVFAHF